MKIQAADVTPGMHIMRGKKQAKVVDVQVIEVPVVRQVRTTVITYQTKDDEDDASALREIHMNADNKIEVVNNTGFWTRVWEIFRGEFHKEPKPKTKVMKVIPGPTSTVPA